MYDMCSIHNLYKLFNIFYEYTLLTCLLLNSDCRCCLSLYTVHVRDVLTNYKNKILIYILSWYISSR